MNRVLVVDDESGMRAALEAHFLRRNWRVDTAADAPEALEKFRRGLHPLVVTAFGTVPDAVTAMKGGACDYLVKPVSFEQLEQAAERILTQAQSQARTQAQSQAKASENLVGHAPVWLRALDRARQAAASDADVLIEAESGTGKELVARMIHRLKIGRA